MIHSKIYTDGSRPEILNAYCDLYGVVAKSVKNPSGKPIKGFYAYNSVPNMAVRAFTDDSYVDNCDTIKTIEDKDIVPTHTKYRYTSVNTPITDIIIRLVKGEILYGDSEGRTWFEWDGKQIMKFSEGHVPIPYTMKNSTIVYERTKVTWEEVATEFVAKCNNQQGIVDISIGGYSRHLSNNDFLALCKLVTEHNKG